MAAALIADQVDLVYMQGIEHLFQHGGIRSWRDNLARLDLGVAVRKQVDGNATADVCESGKLVISEMLVQDDVVDEQPESVSL
jgi:hypothetical protein